MGVLTICLWTFDSNRDKKGRNYNGITKKDFAT